MNIITVQDMLSLYKELSDQDKEVFDILYLNYKKNNKNILKQNKNKVFNELKSTKDIYGNDYFDEQYLKKILHITDEQ